MFQEEKQKLEQYITNYSPLVEPKYLGMNLADAVHGKEIYLKMKNDSMYADYFSFASNGVLQTDYVLYKSNSNIYIFLVKNGVIHSYERIENENWFNKYTGNLKIN